MSKTQTQAALITPALAILNGRQYLSWLTDPEAIGLDDQQVEETIHVALGHRPSHFHGGYDD